MADEDRGQYTRGKWTVESGDDAVTEAIQDKPEQRSSDSRVIVWEPVGQKFSSRSSSTQADIMTRVGFFFFLIDEQRGARKTCCTMKVWWHTKLRKKPKRGTVACVESNANQQSVLSYVSHVSLTPVTSAEWEWMCSTVCWWRDEANKHLVIFRNGNQSVTMNSVLNPGE